MATTRLRLVTVVCEPALVDSLLAEFRAMGVTGHTRMPVEGEGSRGMRAGDPPGAGVRIEMLVQPATAGRLLDRLAEHWFPHYSVVAWAAEVDVVRGEKFV